MVAAEMRSSMNKQYLKKLLLILISGPILGGLLLVILAHYLLPVFFIYLFSGLLVAWILFLPLGLPHTLDHLLPFKHPSKKEPPSSTTENESSKPDGLTEYMTEIENLEYDLLADQAEEHPEKETMPSYEEVELHVADLELKKGRDQFKIYKRLLDCSRIFIAQFRALIEKKYLVYNNYSEHIKMLRESFVDIHGEIINQGSLSIMNLTILEEFINAIESIQESTRHTKEIAKTLLSRVESGYSNLEKTSHLTKEIEGLGKQIADITNLITNVADKTHVLSINAAIESSRAGQFGKGFSVVSQEIRKLAMDTARSSDSIKEMIENISDAITEEVILIEENESLYREINEGVSQTTGLISEVSESLEKNNQNAATLRDWIQQMDKLTTNIDELLVEQEKNLEGFEDMLNELITVNQEITAHDYRPERIQKTSDVEVVQDQMTHHIIELETYIGVLVHLDNELNRINAKITGELRRAERVDVLIDCQVQQMDADGNPIGQVFSSVITNLSSNGALFETTHRCENEERYQLEFYLQDRSNKSDLQTFEGVHIRAVGPVVKTSSVTRKNEAALAVAITFDDVSPQDLCFIAGYLYF
jgi:methyl-accepting chemotaxis protein